MNNQDALMRRHEERADALPFLTKDQVISSARLAYGLGTDDRINKFAMEVPFLGYLVFSVRENPDDPQGKLQTVGLSLVTVQESIFD